MDIELIESMRRLETDHEHHGYPPVTMRDVSALCDEIDRLRAVVAEWEKLCDPCILHANLLRGLPARMSREALLHLIGGCPVAIMDTRNALGLCAPTEADFPALYALQGHRVALVDLGPNAQAKRRPAP